MSYLRVTKCPRFIFLIYYFLKFPSVYIENTLIGEKSIITKHMLVTKADHENIFRSFISVLDGFDEAKNI
jgi:hypothetical protein